MLLANFFMVKPLTLCPIRAGDVTAECYPPQETSAVAELTLNVVKPEHLARVCAECFPAATLRT